MGHRKGENKGVGQTIFPSEGAVPQDAARLPPPTNGCSQVLCMPLGSGPMAPELHSARHDDVCAFSPHSHRSAQWSSRAMCVLPKDMWGSSTWGPSCLLGSQALKVCAKHSHSQWTFLVWKKKFFFVKMLFMLTYNYLKYLETFSVSI